MLAIRSGTALGGCATKVLSSHRGHHAVRSCRAWGASLHRFATANEPPTPPDQDAQRWATFCCVWNEVGRGHGLSQQLAELVGSFVVVGSDKVRKAASL
ncbi:unnamed protein product [Symbiodinium natans]|uniref:Uncharacterized protein n=1 Tax=Symbiodinium natans TaxID=878477 RepID=A0A812G822_9DINO|nr:unnamed protein product [Symbiodinium natans]